MTVETDKDSQNIVMATFSEVFVDHYDNIWNIFDSLINILVLSYLILIYVAQTSYRTYQQNGQADLGQLWYYEKLSEAANILAACSLIISWIRLLYFLLPIPVAGPLVIAVLRMNRDVAYFVLLLAVFIFGFSTVYDLIFAGYWDIFTGYWPTIFSTAKLSIGNIQYSDSAILVPLPIKWFGNVVIIIYVLIAGILAVNFLVAMMGATFTELWETTELKWHQLDGDLLLHYERFLFAPPPLNIFQNLVYLVVLIWNAVIKRFENTEKKHINWQLISEWDHNNEGDNAGENKEDTDAAERKLRKLQATKLLNFWLKDITKREQKEKEKEDGGSDAEGDDEDEDKDENEYVLQTMKSVEQRISQLVKLQNKNPKKKEADEEGIGEASEEEKSEDTKDEKIFSPRVVDSEDEEEKSKSAPDSPHSPPVVLSESDKDE